jgi:site-specific DNA-methyltransferase (adenine-specific)
LTDLYLINQKILLESGGEEIYLEEKMIENYINKVINGDCIEVMGEMPEGSIDLIVTSPPYGVNIAYDTHDDDMEINQYLEFTRNWMTEAYKVLKDDGRIAINIPYEINRQEKGGRIFLVSEVYQVMKQIGFKFFGIVDLEEDSPHRSKTTAWGSWMSPSSPYIYNPKECVILAYKKHHIKKVKGEPQWKGVPTQIEQEDGTFKTKVVYQEEDKKEFMELVFGQWKYLNDSRPLTKATFSMDIPTKAIKILSYKNDIVLDPFNGSGTSCVAAETLDRRWIGIELSPNYTEISRQRIQAFVDQKKQQEIEFENGGL